MKCTTHCDCATKAKAALRMPHESVADPQSPNPRGLEYTTYIPSRITGPNVASQPPIFVAV
jgi:hypothetical protein